MQFGNNRRTNVVLFNNQTLKDRARTAAENEVDRVICQCRTPVMKMKTPMNVTAKNRKTNHTTGRGKTIEVAKMTV